MPIVRLIVFLSCLVMFHSMCHAENMIQNPHFENWTGKVPVKWAIASNEQSIAQRSADGRTVLHVEIIADGGKRFGEIRQTVKVQPNTIYKFSGEIKASKDGAGFFQIKPRSNGKELKRINTASNKGADWCRIENEIDSGLAQEIQILCRFRQSTNYAGIEIDFADLNLTAVGQSTAPVASDTPKTVSPSPSPSTVSLDQRVLQIAQDGKDMYLSPQGSGRKDGSDWDNAMAASGDGLQHAWNAAGSGNTVYVGSGTYKDIQLQINVGGSDAFNPITLQGVDTGEGLPRFISTWDKTQPARGLILIRLGESVGHIQIASLRVEHYMVGVVLSGKNVGIRIFDVDANDVREGFILNGGATPDQPLLGTADVVISDCKVIGYTKRCVRIRNGVSLVRIINCDADAGGKDYATEPFQMGYHVEGSKLPGVSDRDISFINCTARNNYHEHGNKYWNADGFCTEPNVYNVSYIGCRSFDNTDGGWDVKAYNPVFVDCIALRNKRNFRVWSRGLAVFTNCLGAYAIKRGGNGTAAGIHINLDARVIATNCTFVGNDIGVDLDTTGHDKKPHQDFAQLRNCIIANNQNPITIESGGKLKLVDCNIDSQQLDPEALPVIIQQNTRNQDPQLISPKPEWEGGDEAFNSRHFNDTGYHSH